MRVITSILFDFLDSDCSNAYFLGFLLLMSMVRCDNSNNNN